MNTAECSQHLQGFTDGFSASFSLCLSFLICCAGAYFIKELIFRIEFRPVAPTLAELERRHKYLGIMIERKKRRLVGQSNEA